MKTTFARLGLARLASDHLFALTLVFLGLPCLLSAQTLAHRYSFATDASDSVGGSAWNGTIIPPTTGSAATISSGLILPGNASAGSGISGYLSLPNGIILGDASITVECWVNPTSSVRNTEIWHFRHHQRDQDQLRAHPQRQRESNKSGLYSKQRRGGYCGEWWSPAGRCNVLRCGHLRQFHLKRQSLSQRSPGWRDLFRQY